MVFSARYNKDLLVAAVAFLFSGSLFAAPTVVRRDLVDGVEFTILEPPIDSAVLTPFPQIEVSPGDAVTVQARGCADRGGYYDGIAFRTTYDYVNPLAGLAPDRGGDLYWGSISIPGATRGAIRIADAIRLSTASPILVEPITCGGTRDPGQIVSLGYVDDDYGDNTYKLREKSHQNQCDGKGPASVTITIRKSGGVPPRPTKALDLSVTRLDQNGFAFEPFFSGPLPDAKSLIRNARYHSNAFSQRPSEDGNDLCLLDVNGATIGHRQHVNLEIATFEGRLDFEDIDGIDGEHEFNLFPSKVPGALVQANSPRYHLAVHPRDAFDLFQSTFWKAYRLDPRVVSGRRAVMTGLYGLDNVHSATAELHPTFAAAIERPAGDSNFDTWDLFLFTHARTGSGLLGDPRGGEGYCSEFDHSLTPLSIENGLLRKFSFELPWRAGASDFALIPAPAGDLVDAFGNPMTPTAERCRDRLVVTFQWDPSLYRLGDPKINGSLSIRWIP